MTGRGDGGRRPHAANTPAVGLYCDIRYLGLGCRAPLSILYISEISCICILCYPSSNLQNSCLAWTFASMASRIRLNASAMRGLRRPVSCRSPMTKGHRHQRYNSTNTGYSNQIPFWTTNRVVLLSAFTGALAYTYGLWDARSNTKKDETTISQKPIYAKKAEWEKVGLLLTMCLLGILLISVTGNRGSQSKTR